MERGTNGLSATIGAAAVASGAGGWCLVTEMVATGDVCSG